MLISGPPGLGKTTLAHIVARHAGYRPTEINASDERSAKVLKQRVKEATEAQAVFGDRRPVLIILDEIDGAMGGSEGAGAIQGGCLAAPRARPPQARPPPLYRHAASAVEVRHRHVDRRARVHSTSNHHRHAPHA